MVLATAFVVWYMAAGYRIGTYESGTRLGSVYIGGLTQEEVIPLMDERITYWYNDDTVVFQMKYQGYTYEFDRDLLLFDLQESTQKINQGEDNTLFVYFQSEDLDNIRSDIENLPYMQNVIDNVDLNSLFKEVLYDASMMKSFSSKNVEDFLIDKDLSTEVVRSVDFKVPEGVLIDNVINTINANFTDGKILIPSNQLFDVIAILGDQLNDQELTMLSTAMLGTILETNFIINEVHYNPVIDFTTYTIDNYPYYGRNTEINRIVDNSFNFYNPNVFEYYFTIEKTDDYHGKVLLNGLPFEYDINVQVNKTEIPYIVQKTNKVDLLQEGYNGVIVEVNRVITDVYGNEVSDKNIVFEFYPPVAQIIFEP
jgi:hypothetical protein